MSVLYPDGGNAEEVLVGSGHFIVLKLKACWSLLYDPCLEARTFEIFHRNDKHFEL